MNLYYLDNLYSLRNLTMTLGEWLQKQIINMNLFDLDIPCAT